MMKMRVIVVLMIAMIGITSVPIQASERQEYNKEQKNKVISDEEQKLLKEENIQVISDENGNIKLKNTSASAINEANQILRKSKKYPTEWYPLKNYSVYSSKKFKKATKSAFATYYFVNSDECNVYFRYLYYYRIIGPMKIDNNGNAIGQYELKRKMTTSKNKKFTSGQNKIQTKKSSILSW